MLVLDHLRVTLDLDNPVQILRVLIPKDNLVHLEQALESLPGHGASLLYKWNQKSQKVRWIW